MSNAKDVIDLTSSLNMCYPGSLSDTVIVIDSDDSLDYSSQSEEKKQELHSKNNENKMKEKTVSSLKKEQIDNESTLDKFGDCAICFEEIGKNPLASTKCGHVFCIACLKKTLKVLNRCPTCRRLLKGKAAYHPLYLCKQ